LYPLITALIEVSIRKGELLLAITKMSQAIFFSFYEVSLERGYLSCRFIFSVQISSNLTNMVYLMVIFSKRFLSSSVRF
jgi:hypothetical protein